MFHAAYNGHVGRNMWYKFTLIKIVSSQLWLMAFLFLCTFRGLLTCVCGRTRPCWWNETSYRAKKYVYVALGLNLHKLVINLGFLFYQNPRLVTEEKNSTTASLAGLKRRSKWLPVSGGIAGPLCPEAINTVHCPLSFGVRREADNLWP
jgi:hypothetical protein